MKTQIKKTMMAIALLAAGFVATANENEREIELTTVKQKAVVLKMQNIQEGTQISLYNAEGELLFEDKANSNVYGKVLNLQLLAPGQLRLEVENDESVEILAIDVSEGHAEMNKANRMLISKPIVKHNGDEMKIFLGDNCVDMKVSIYDEFGDLVNRSEIKKGAAKAKRYDISDLADGNYNIQFTADGRSFYHTITLD